MNEFEVADTGGKISIRTLMV